MNNCMIFCLTGNSQCWTVGETKLNYEHSTIGTSQESHAKVETLRDQLAQNDAKGNQTKMSDIKLGSLITKQQYRDAIHVAIVPVSSKQNLIPGQHVGLVDGSTAEVTSRTIGIGIVDPFLVERVTPGQQFWLLLYPQTITSLRHDWTHPAFPVKSESEQWIRYFADSVGLGYGALMVDAEHWLRTGDYADHGDLLEGRSVPDEFWEHYEKVTGKSVPDASKQSFFSCSC